ncbi:MAG: PaaI family thioesterase [Oscillospiraceae bacterium]|jgi:acyl-CoA thioesterase|nr:PaaI family thioesterase [Oscillospiraceae bacterium]
MEHDLQTFRDFFAADKFAANIGVVIDSVTDDRVTCSMILHDGHRNAGGGVQGGAIFTLADLCFAVACNTDYVLGRVLGMSVGINCAISYLKGTRGKALYAQSTCLNRGRTTSVYRIHITDDLGIDIAEMLCTSYAKQ